MAEPRFAGEPVVLGGAVYTVPPMALRAVVRLKSKIEALDGVVSEEEQMAIGFDLIHAALSRNYPEIEREEMDVMITPAEFAPAFETVLRLSGFSSKPATSDGSEGNARRARSVPSTGTRSTPGSAPRSGGRGSTSTSS